MAEPTYYLKEILPGRLPGPEPGAAAREADTPATAERSPGVLVDIVESDIDLYYRMALEMYTAVAANNAAHRRSVFIVPVGPTFQYRRFVYLCREMPIDLSGMHLFFMDEYLAPSAAGGVQGGAQGGAQGGPPALIDFDAPLSFRGFVARELVEPLLALDAEAVSGARLDPAAGAVPAPGATAAPHAGDGSATGFTADHVYFPDPADPGAYDRRLEELGGADICFAGVGINGHLAFNEPPREEDEGFFDLGTRVVELSRETITINSNTALGGAWEQIPARAVTVGLKQILSSRSLRIFLNRPWQRAVARKLLFGPVTSTFPASAVQNHRDGRVTMTAEVASPPKFGLR